MKIHEFQAKGILKEYGVAVLEGYEATTVEEAVTAAETLGGSSTLFLKEIQSLYTRNL